MLNCFNSDINVNGCDYHVQTEDWGQEKAYVVSQVFRNGAVVKSIRTSYQEILPFDLQDRRRALHEAMQFQHEKILDQLLSGQLL